MPFILKVDGDDQVLEVGLDSFVRAHGWAESHELSKLDYATSVIRNFLRNSIQNYQIEQARSQAAVLAMAQSTQVLDTMTTTLELVPVTPAPEA